MSIEVMPVHGNGILCFLSKVCNLNLEEYWALEMCKGDQFSAGFPALRQTAVQRNAFRSLQEKNRVLYSVHTGRWELTELGRGTLDVVDIYHRHTEPSSPTHRKVIEFPSLDIRETKRETVNT